MRNIFILHLLIVLLIGSSCAEEEVITEVIPTPDYTGYWEINSSYIHASDQIMLKDNLYDHDRIVFRGLEIYEEGEQTYMLEKEKTMDHAVITRLWLLDFKETGEAYVRNPDSGLVMPFFTAFEMIDHQLVMHTGHQTNSSSNYFDRINAGHWDQF